MSRYAFASTNDLEIAYLEWSPQGERNAVLLHGWPDSPHGWKAVAETLASAGYRVLAPARFRHAATPRSGQLAALGCDLLGLIDSLALRRPLLVGMTGALARWPMLAACARALAHREAQLLPRHAWLCRPWSCTAARTPVPILTAPAAANSISADATGACCWMASATSRRARRPCEALRKRSPVGRITASRLSADAGRGDG
ncbi:Non-heme chloroperoxidase [Streptococcus dysgalactiae subsp. equisimilis]|nr:hypothetical protein AN454_14790 [Pseudomonas aeruginosa]VTS36561.1 Non-heme chloroperoxidase [Streptococcus dysgalactiae subsp. equisimilis]